MGRSNDWSISNSTGTTDMGIWAEEDPDVSSSPLETQSEIKPKPKPQFGYFHEGLPTHRYPLYIDNTNSENNVPLVQECIHFTVVKQGGISLQKVADNDRALAAYENKQNNIANVAPDDQDFAGTGDLGGDTGALGGTGATGSFASADLPQKQNIETANAGGAQNTAAGGGRTKQQKENNSALAKFGALITGQKDLVRQPAKNLEHCFLYMPNSVQFSEGATWGAEALGATGNATKQLIKSPGGDIGDILKNFTGGIVAKTGQAVGLAASAAAGKVLAKSAVLGLVSAGAIFEGIGGGLRAAGRFTQNPYEEQLFNGIDFRTFTFDFAFAPANSSEAIEVDSIIKMFRFHSRPSFVGGFLGEGLYSFPNEFNIEFMMNYNGTFIEHSQIPSIHNCVCTNVSTNYTPEGFWVALKDGRAVSYTLSLAFTETKKITQQDIGGKPGGY